MRGSVSIAPGIYGQLASYRNFQLTAGFCRGSVCIINATNSAVHLVGCCTVFECVDGDRADVGSFERADAFQDFEVGRVCDRARLFP